MVDVRELVILVPWMHASARENGSEVCGQQHLTMYYFFLSCSDSDEETTLMSTQ